MKKKNYYKKKNKKRRQKALSITFWVLFALALYAFLPIDLKETFFKIDSFIDFQLKKLTYTHLIIAIILALIILRYFKLLKRNIGAGKRLDKIDVMSGEDFERYLMYNFQKRGYRVKTTPVTGDYGADLILSKNGTKICVQAKRYKSNVGNGAVQEIVAALAYYKCDYGMVITNSYFTAAAKTLAKVNNVELWDRNRIINEFNIKK